MSDYQYVIEEKFLKRFADKIENEEEIRVNVFCNEDLQWKTIKGFISKKSIEGGQQIGLYSGFGVYTETESPLYLKVIEELEFEGDQEGRILDPRL